MAKQILVPLDVSGDISDNSGNTIYDYSNSYIPDAILQKTWGADRDAGDNSITNLLSILDSAQSSPPDSPSNGDFYMDDGSNTEDSFAGLRQFTNGAWEDVGAGGGGEMDTVIAEDQLTLPTYATLADVPTDFPEGTIVWVEDENTIYKEDGE